MRPHTSVQLKDINDITPVMQNQLTEAYANNTRLANILSGMLGRLPKIGDTFKLVDASGKFIQICTIVTVDTNDAEGVLAFTVRLDDKDGTYRETEASRLRSTTCLTDEEKKVVNGMQFITAGKKTHTNCTARGGFHLDIGCINEGIEGGVIQHDISILTRSLNVTITTSRHISSPAIHVLSNSLMKWMHIWTLLLGCLQCIHNTLPAHHVCVVSHKMDRVAEKRMHIQYKNSNKRSSCQEMSKGE